MGLDLWRATVIKHESEHKLCEGVPWRSTDELYRTIDSITAGNVSWKTHQYHYVGPKPLMPPQWMEKTYELNVRDVLAVLEQQVGSTEFDGQFEYTPYEEYDPQGDRVYSHLMSAYWANREAVCFLFQGIFIRLYEVSEYHRRRPIDAWCHAGTGDFWQ
jgi:hypothetical protein